MGNMRISVGLFCRVLPHYRIPIFERLANVADIDLTVYYSREPRHFSLRTVDPQDLFSNRRIALRTFRFCGQDVYLQPELRRVVASGKHEVVVLYANPRLLSTFPALLAARKRKVGVVWWSMGVSPNQSSVTLAIRLWLMHIPDAILLYTKDERDYFVSKGLPQERVFVAQNTICVKAETEAAKKWSKDKLERFVIERGLEGKRLFLFCGRLRERKGIELLLEAFKLLLSEDPRYHLCMIGPGDSQRRFSELSQQKGIGSAITWLGPIYDSNKLAPWFLVSRALVVPRAIGLASFHGFAYGLPCITSDERCYQTPEATGLLDEFNCLLFRDGNVTDLVEKMKMIDENDELFANLSLNAKRTMDEEYTVDKMVNGFCEAIRYAKACVSR